MPKEPQAGATRCRSTICGRSTFEDVTFQHQIGVVAGAVSDISFSVERGETIAFVGPSGAGKTTLVKLLVGLYRPQAGRHPLQRHRRATTIDLDGLRERIGFVTQDTQLFSGTIRENLLFVSPTRPTPSASTCCARPRATACSRAPTGASTR